MTKADEQLYADAVAKLGSKTVTNVFRPDVAFSHMVIGGQNPKNAKVALGIARGAWIVSADWITQCVETRAFADADEFEVNHLPGAAKARKTRKPLLSHLGFRIVGDTSPSPEELRCIVEAAGGRVVKTQSESSICIASAQERARKRNLFATAVLTEDKFMEALFNGVVPALWIEGGTLA